MNEFSVGQKVIAKVDMVNDLTEDGLGVELCAASGDELIIRKIRTTYLTVSHEHITDRYFCVSPEEIMPIQGK